jgi:c-di-GMP-binding flagellar brake protein YcgR
VQPTVARDQFLLFDEFLIVPADLEHAPYPLELLQRRRLRRVRIPVIPAIPPASKKPAAAAPISASR